MIPQNNTPCTFLGADVAKDTITFFCPRLNQTKTLPNRIVSLRGFLKKHQDQALVLEATGGYETRLIELALASGIVVYRVNPYRVRAFMRATGQNAKTDALDARALAAFAAQHQATLRPFVLPSPDEKKLHQLARRRDELIVMRTQEKNRLQAPDNAALRPSLRAVLACLTKQIEALDKQLAEIVRSCAALCRKVEVLTNVAGVGPITATNLLAAMPEIGTLDRKTVAALAGLAPFAKDSGTKSGYRRTGRGRRDVRRILFMAAFAASRYNPQLKTFYTRLIQNGKKPMLALIAVARKLLTILNAKLRDDALLQQS